MLYEFFFEAKFLNIEDYISNSQWKNYNESDNEINMKSGNAFTMNSHCFYHYDLFV
jgi:hypothetical protein